MSTIPAVLVLSDGTIFKGDSIGAQGHTIGELVFNTSMTGYQEILTDPSYTHQIVTLTYPHIGNVGANSEDTESRAVFASGLVIRDLPLIHSNFRADMSLAEYLIQHNIVAIANIDTRALTRHLRMSGSMAACILTGVDASAEVALNHAKSFGSMAGKDLAKVVTCEESYRWSQGEWQLGEGYSAAPTANYHVVAYDFGVKHNILNMLVQRGCQVTVVPAQTSVDEVLALQPDGVFLSNGPGDPEPCDYAIASIQALLARKMPMFGICLGHQLLGLASGAKTSKMKFGHHGANHPVQDLQSQRVFITSQNHGFQVDETSLPTNVVITHRSLFDQSVQGIRLLDVPAFSFQGHPEASPGPNDIAYLFDQFVDLMQTHKSV